MECSITWHCSAPPDWDAKFARIRRSTLLQCRQYAAALCPAQGQTYRLGEVFIDGQAAGLVQIQEASILRRSIHALILDRGPLWFEGYGENRHLRAFFEVFTRHFPARLGRKRRVIPECAMQQAPKVFDTLDFTEAGGHSPYQTYWIDLRPEADALRAGLKSKWRNLLNKAEKSGLETRWDWAGNGHARMIAHYSADKAEQGYAGPDTQTLARLAGTFAPCGQLGIGWVTSDGVPAAGLMVLCHGTSATYQVGFVTEVGRRKAANYLLLWNLMIQLKSRGIDDLDLGGVNDGDAAGVKKFKSGLAGELVEYAGQFR